MFWAKRRKILVLESELAHIQAIFAVERSAVELRDKQIRELKARIEETEPKLIDQLAQAQLERDLLLKRVEELEGALRYDNAWRLDEREYPEDRKNAEEIGKAFEEEFPKRDV